jgi:hypothetical protein
MSEQSIRRALTELDAPASRCHDPPGTTIGDGEHRVNIRKSRSALLAALPASAPRT